MPTVESKPAQPAAVSPSMPNTERIEKLCAERAALKTERDGSISTTIALQLLRDGEVASEVKARRDAITERLRDLDELEAALRPLALREERVKLIADQLAAFELRKLNQSKAAGVQAHIDDLNTQITEAEKQLHRWKVTEPDGIFGSSQRLTRHRNAHPEIEG